MRTLLFAAALLMSASASAADLFNATRLECEFIQGGQWDFELSPPTIRVPIETSQRVSISSKDKNRPIAQQSTISWRMRRFVGSSPQPHDAIVYSEMGTLAVLTTYSGEATPSIIQISPFVSLLGWPALYQDGYNQLQGYCNSY